MPTTRTTPKPVKRDPHRSLIARPVGGQTVEDARETLVPLHAMGPKKHAMAQRVTVQCYEEPPWDSHLTPTFVAALVHQILSEVGVPEVHLCNVPLAAIPVGMPPAVRYSLVIPAADGTPEHPVFMVDKDEYVAAVVDLRARYHTGKGVAE